MPHGRFIRAYGHYTTPNCLYGRLLASLISRVIRGMLLLDNQNTDLRLPLPTNRKKQEKEKQVRMVITIITCRLVLDIRAHMHTGNDVTHGPHILTALPMEHRNWATQRRTVDGVVVGSGWQKLVLKTACARYYATLAWPG